MSARFPPALIGLSSLAAMLAPVQMVVAADYLSVEAAQRALFAQADRFDEIVLALSAEQRQAVTGIAGPQPPHRSLRAWKAVRGDETLGYVFVDEVLGRQ